MSIFIFSFTRAASILSLKLQHYFSEHQMTCTAYSLEKYISSPNLTPLTKPLKEHVKDCFQKENVIIFISACGIAVRSIAPFIRSKTTDPCVLVIDEKGQYVISLLSGHIGGGNAFTKQTADFLHAVPIISTATDLNQKFAVDTFAKNNHLFLSDMKLAKEVSASLLDHIPVGISGIIPEGELPEGIFLSGKKISSADICLSAEEALSEAMCLPDEEVHSETICLPNEELGICIRAFTEPVPFSRTLFLIPKQVVLGIGCKKDTPFTHLHSFVNSILDQYHIHPKSLKAITSIDLKKEEQGLLQLAETYDVPFITYDTKTLLDVPGDFTASEFVKNVTGVNNVCERSALAYTKSGQLFLRKTPYQGMTIAISLLPIHLRWDII